MIACGGTPFESLKSCTPVTLQSLPTGCCLTSCEWGVNDWVGENSRGHQSTQALRLATALASRMIRITNADHANVSDVARGLENRR